jgi:hypothetical protein
MIPKSGNRFSDKIMRMKVKSGGGINGSTAPSNVILRWTEARAFITAIPLCPRNRYEHVLLTHANPKAGRKSSEEPLATGNL